MKKKSTPVTEFEDADLLAHLSGEDVPGLIEAIKRSPELAERLSVIKTQNDRLKKLFGGVGVPDPQDLIDVVTGQASAQTRLVVDAYVRNSPSGKQLMDLLRKEYTQLERESAPSKIRLPIFLAVPARLGIALRSANDEEDPFARPREGAYETTELEAKVAYRIVPLRQEKFRIEGTVLHKGLPAIDAHVSIRGDKGRTRVTQTTSIGYFVFDKVAPGTYRLRIQVGGGILETPLIETPHD